MTTTADGNQSSSDTPGMPLIELDGVTKVYRTGRLEYPALRGVDLRVNQGEMLSIIGPSGSGKSTILNMITGIDRPTAGTVTVDNQDLGQMSEEGLAAWRGKNVGIVFQFFQLLPTLTASQNVMLPMELAKVFRGERKQRALHNLELVGLSHVTEHVPTELSGGEQQRVAIARALACSPLLIVGDEPTGNLDSDTAMRVFDVLTELNSTGVTVIYVTHDPELASRSRRTVTIRDGVIAGDERR